MSEAFKLMEEGKILVHKNDKSGYGYTLFPCDNVIYGQINDLGEIVKGSLAIGSFSHNFCGYLEIYKPPKPKVQYYQAAINDKNNGQTRVTSFLYTSEDDFNNRRTNKNQELIQLVPFGEPV